MSALTGENQLLQQLARAASISGSTWLDPNLEDSCGHQQRSRKDSWLRSCQVCRQRAFRTMRDWLSLPPWAMMSRSYLLASGIMSFSTYLCGKSQMAEGAFIWCGAETNCEVLSSMLSGGGRPPQSAR